MRLGRHRHTHTHPHTLSSCCMWQMSHVNTLIHSCTHMARLEGRARGALEPKKKNAIALKANALRLASVCVGVHVCIYVCVCVRLCRKLVHGRFIYYLFLPLHLLQLEFFCGAAKYATKFHCLAYIENEIRKNKKRKQTHIAFPHHWVAL